MASTYDISTGSGRVQLDLQPDTDISGVFVISSSSLDAKIELKLQQSGDGVNFNDLPETPIRADAGMNSNLLQTQSYVGGSLYLYIDVLTATVGTLNLFSFGK